jgi:hypothetical protein
MANKHPQLIAKGSGYALGVVMKGLRARNIFTNCGKVASAANEILKDSALISSLELATVIS